MSSHLTRRELLKAAALAGAAAAGVTAASPHAAHSYYIASDGSDSGDGSRGAPWKTLQRAAKSVKPGDAVVIRHGVYLGPSCHFGPAGLDAAHRVTYRAFPGERPLFTGDDGLPPEITLDDYVRLEGLWFGGRWEKGKRAVHPGGSPISRGKQIIGCTIFGYRCDGIGIGSAQDLLIESNRLVRCGDGSYSHGIYLSGGYTAGAMTQHVVIDNNILVRGEGYAIHGWHNPRSCIVTRNFVSGYFWGIVLNGSDHLVANNVLWSMKRPAGSGPGWDAWLPGERIVFENNVLNCPTAILAVGQNDVISGNAYLAAAAFPKDDHPFVCNLAARQETQPLDPAAERRAQALKEWAGRVDAACSAIDDAFAAPIESVLSNDAIEHHFRVLSHPPPPDSGLASAGSTLPWGASAGNGIGRAAHIRAGGFWNGFGAAKLKHYNNRGAEVRSLDEALHGQ